MVCCVSCVLDVIGIVATRHGQKPTLPYWVVCSLFWPFSRLGLCLSNPPRWSAVRAPVGTVNGASINPFHNLDNQHGRSCTHVQCARLRPRWLRQIVGYSESPFWVPFALDPRWIGTQ